MLLACSPVETFFPPPKENLFSSWLYFWFLSFWANKPKFKRRRNVFGYCITQSGNYSNQSDKENSSLFLGEGDGAVGRARVLGIFYEPEKRLKWTENTTQALKAQHADTLTGIGICYMVYWGESHTYVTLFFGVKKC